MVYYDITKLHYYFGSNDKILHHENIIYYQQCKNLPSLFPDQKVMPSSPKAPVLAVLELRLNFITRKFPFPGRSQNNRNKN